MSQLVKPLKPRQRTGGRPLSVRVKTARGRKISSTRWLQRQLNDEYVMKAKDEGYRSRAAYKLIELNDKFSFLTPGAHVVDLGAAPGGWSQVAKKLVGSKGTVIAVDISEMESLPDITVLQQDFLEPEAPDIVKSYLPEGRVDVVLSDMAAPATGHNLTDHLRIIGLAETALDFAIEVLTVGGVFIAKVLQGGSEKTLLDKLKKNFKVVKHVKPKASRKDSAEMYVVGIGFKGS